MDIYLVSDTMRNEEVITKYISFIWSERYQAEGDFELVMSKADSDHSALRVGRWIAHSDTHRVCIIDTKEEKESDDGEQLVVWSGISLEGWLYRRRSILRTKMPTYHWYKTPHNSASIEKFNGVETRRNHYIDPHFANSQNATESKNPPTGDDVSGTLRVNDGTVSISNVNTTSGGYRSFYYALTPQLFATPSRTKNGWTFWIYVDDLSLSTGARAIVQLNMYLNKTLLSSTNSVAITEPGWVSVSSPVETSTPNYYVIYYLVDNSATTARPAITDCSASFSQPMLLMGRNKPFSSFFSGAMSYLMLNPERKFEGTVEQIMNTVINETVISNQDRPQENLPLALGFPPTGVDGYKLAPLADTPVENVEAYFGPGTVYDALVSLAETYDLGFCVMRDPKTGMLYTTTYVGTDRTTRQSLRTQILYDPEMGTLTNGVALESIRNRRTYAIVYGKYDYVICDSLGSRVTHEEAYGVDRELLVVDQTSIDLPHGTEELYSTLVQKGREALNAHQRVTTMDGEIPEYSLYKYEKDFGTGSMVTIRNRQGGVSLMRVSEYIFTSDSDGYRSYPTLTTNKYLNPGTWEAVPPSIVWQTVEGEWVNK